MEINYTFLVVLTALFVTTKAVDQEEVAGTNVTMECRLTGVLPFPTWKGPPSSAVYLQEGGETNPNYTWVSYADDNKTLVITDAQTQHSGDYTCEEDGNAAETISLNVLAKPMVLLENKVDVVYGNFRRSQVITGLEDKNITVKCTASGGNPQPRIDLVMPDNKTMDDYESSVTALENTYTVTMSGTFLAKRNYDRIEVVCKATNPAPTNKLGDYSEEDRATVYLKLKPNLFATTRPGSVDVGKNLTVSCDAANGRPAPTITWLFDGQPVDASRFVVGSTTEEPVQASETIAVMQNITLVGVRREDNKKVFVCSVGHEAFDIPSRLLDPTIVKVNFGPDYVNITGNEKTFASEGASLTLTCSTATLGTVAENPTYTIIRWRNDTNDQLIESESKLTLTEGENNGTEVSQDLTINVTRYMDGQTVTCFVYQQDQVRTEVTATVTLDIDYPPIITEPENDVVRFAVHDNASLRCSVKSKPPANFTWYEDGNNNPLAEGTGTIERNEFSLQWTDIGYNASGKYKCIATNGHGRYKDERVVEVLITGSPRLPSELTFVDSGTDALTMSFSPSAEEPDIYQSYYLQYRGTADEVPNPWHEVSLPADATNFKLRNLKHGTVYHLRIKVVNKYGSTRYTDTQTMKTQDVEIEDGITQKDLDIAISVSVVVTAVVIVTLVFIIYVCRKKRMCGSSSEKFELQTR